MTAEDGLKAQKLLAQGIALGKVAINNAPCKGKSFFNSWYLKAFALTGRQACVHLEPRVLPWARSFCPFRACGVWSFSLSGVLTVTDDTPSL